MTFLSIIESVEPGNHPSTVCTVEFSSLVKQSRNNWRALSMCRNHQNGLWCLLHFLDKNACEGESYKQLQLLLDCMYNFHGKWVHDDQLVIKVPWMIAVLKEVQ